MSAWQKGIKYAALALAILLIVSVVSGILQALSFLPGLRGSGDDAVGEMRDHALEGDISSLKMDLTAAELTIQTGDRFTVSSNLSGLSVKNRDGRLIIEEKSRWTTGKNRAKVVLTIPRDIVFDRVDLDTGAGLVWIEDLEAKTVDLDLGAGKVEISRLVATDEADIDGGAGAVTISSGQIQNLDLDVGVGKMTLTAKLTGENRLDMGVGAGEITLLGRDQDYRFRIDKGLGEITVAGTPTADGAAWGDGQTLVRVDGGVGSVHIRFQQE